MPSLPQRIRVAHIKRNTEGTSNEISLDVLDAARQSLDERKPTAKQRLLRISGGVPHISLPLGKRSDVSRETSEVAAGRTVEYTAPSDRVDPAPSKRIPRKLRQGRGHLRARRTTSPSDATAASSGKRASSPQDQAAFEIARRKRRRAMKRAGRAALAVLAIVAIGVAGYTAFTYVKEDRGNEAMFSRALNKIGETDTTLAALDSFVEDPVKATEKGVWVAAHSDIAAAKDSLGEASSLLRTLSSRRLPHGVSAAMTAARENVEARQQMIGEAERVMEKAAAAQDLLKRLRGAWSSLQEGDTLAREAAGLSSKAASVDEIKDVREKGARAVQRFNDALDGFSSALSAAPGIKVEPYIEYIEARLEALGYADAADAALIDRNKDEARAQNDRYTESDERASRLAKGLPVSVDQVVLDFVQAQSSSEAESYRRARAEATQSDSELRDYLGTQSK